MRKYRKQEHIENFLKSTQKSNNLFDQVFVYHQATSCLDYDDIDCSTTFLGRKIGFPYMINAITGGTRYANDINMDLARIAQELDIPMAVGSQTIALEDRSSSQSFKIVRQVNPYGLVIGNVSALRPIDEVLAAIEMIEADAFQLHLNLGQELIMEEGDRDFSNLLDNIGDIVSKSPVPIIVKEIGLGLSRQAIENLYDRGVRIVDIAGRGGSSFIEIENLRNPQIDYSELYDWGIPTALALIEAVGLGKDDLTIISSGGIGKARDIFKSLVIGADMTAASSELINYLIRGDYERARAYVLALKEKLKVLMLLSNARTIVDLKNLEYKLSGKLADLVNGPLTS